MTGTDRRRRAATALAVTGGSGLASLLLAYGVVGGFADAPLVKGAAVPYLLVAVLAVAAVALAREGAGIVPLWFLFTAPLLALGAFGQYLVTTVWAGPGVGQYLPTAVAVAAPGGIVLAGLAGAIGWRLGGHSSGGRDRGLRRRLLGREPRATARYLAVGAVAASLVFVGERFAAGLGRPEPAVAIAVGFLAVAAWGTLGRRWRLALAAGGPAAVTLTVLAAGPAYELAWGALVVLPALAVERNDGAVVPLALAGVSTFYLAAAFSTGTLGVGLGDVLGIGAVVALLAALPLGGVGYLLGRALAGRPGRSARVPPRQD